MAYRLHLKPAAGRRLARLKEVDRVALQGVILGLAGNPRPRGALRLKGTRDLWRVRVRVDGRAWRVVYQVDDANRLIVLLRIAARDEGTYRRPR